MTEVDTRWGGSFGHLTAIVEKEGEDVRVPLCRIAYLGDDNARGFAMCLSATDAHAEAVLRTGSPTAAFDTGALVHLADYRA